MKALISGRVGRAVVEDERDLVSVVPSFPDRLTSESELAEFVNLGTSLEVVEVNSLAEAAHATAAAKQIEDLLFLTLSSLNPDLTLTSRVACAAYLDDVIDSSVRMKLLNRLLSAPLPPNVRASQRSLLEIITPFPQLDALVQEVFASQEAVETVEGAFAQAIKDILPNRRTEFKAELDHLETYSQLVLAINQGDRDALNRVVVSALFELNKTDLAFSANLVFSTVAAALRRGLRVATRPKRTLDLFGRAEMRGIRSKTSTQATVDDLLASDTENSFSKLSVFETKTNIDKQLEGIRKQILDGRADLVTRYVTDLVRFKLTHSERVHLGKSLCLLATVSLAANQLEMADELSTYAYTLGVEDPYIYNVRAEVLKYSGKFDASIAAYRLSKIKFPDSAYAWNGEADVLKESGRYTEALAAYKTIQNRFSDNPVAFNGYVSTLRKMGSYSAAAREGYKVRSTFKDHPVIEAELGQCLLAIGKPKRAADHFRLALSINPKDTQAFLSLLRALNESGEGETALRQALKRAASEPLNPALQSALATQYRIMGHLERAEQKARELVRAFPGYSPGRYSLAAILLLRGSPITEDQALPTSGLRSESDWRGYRVYLVALLKTSPKESVGEIQNAVKTCPWASIRQSLSTLLGVVLSQNERRSEALQVLQADLSILGNHQKQTRLALIGAINLISNQKQTGRVVLERVMSTKEVHLKTFRDHVLSGASISAPILLPVLLAA